MRREDHGWSVVLVATVSIATGCFDLTGHHCDPTLGAAQCGTHGVCEPEGACSFPDTSCPSGRSFGAETSHAGECVKRDPCNGSAGATVTLDAMQNAATKGSEPDTTINTVSSIRIDPNDNLSCIGSGQPEFGLLQFDLIQLAGATLVSADLLVTSDELLSGAVLVAPVLESWVETGVTWNDRNTALPWATPGPRDPGSIGLAWVNHAPVVAGRVDIPLGTEPQRWIDDPIDNHGVVLQVEDSACDGVNLASRTAAAVETRPALRLVLTCR